jgi:uncharacterized protein YndB with AHSA1/START domain
MGSATDSGKERSMAKAEIIAEPGMPQILITREFDAPRALVFRAYTDPELLARWYGPRRYTTTIERHEPRDGGTWRILHHDADGHAYGFHGVFHGTPSPDGMVRTFEYEGAPGHVSLESVTFEERGGRTLMRLNAVFQAVEDRDAMIESGMEGGFNESMERLDELLAQLAPAR